MSFCRLSREKISDAWLESAGHSKMTGGKRASINAEPGAEFTAWNGFITSRNVMLERPRRIVQTWRTTRFIETDAELADQVSLEPAAGGTASPSSTAMCRTTRPATATAAGSAAISEPMKKYFGGEGGPV